MTLADYRSRNTRRRLPIIELLSIGAVLVAALLFGLELRDYSSSSDSLGADVKMGGVQVGGLNESQRLEQLEKVYVEQPIFLRYNGNPIWLYPAEVGFQLDMEGMQAAATAESGREDNYWAGFWNYLWREPQPAIEVDLMATYNEEELDKYLQDISNRYDASAQGASFDLVSMEFSGGTGNTQLDKDAARPMIASALFTSDATLRSIDLPTVTLQGEAATMDTLREAIISYLNSQGIFYDGDTIAVSVYVQNLNTGEEMGILPNVQHSALSTIKVGILISYFRNKITSPTDDEKFHLAATVICSINSSANSLMQASVDYNEIFSQGVQYTTDTMCEAGATNTAIRSNLYNGTREELNSAGFNGDTYYATIPDTPCPTSSIGNELDTSVQPQVDSYNKTTAADMGTMLMGIYDCAMYGSGLHSIFPDEITQFECQQILEVLNGTRFEHLAELGVPQEISQHNMYHKVGYGMTFNEAGTSTIGGTGVVADVGIVTSANTDYVFAIYISEKDTDNDGNANYSRWFTVSDISRIIWNYFNPDQSLEQTREPIEDLGGTGCVLPYSGSEVSLTDIDANRFDENDRPLASACYDYPNCRPYNH